MNRIDALRKRIDQSDPRNRPGFNKDEQERLKRLFSEQDRYSFRVEASLVAANLDSLWQISNITGSRKIVPSQIVVLTRNLPETNFTTQEIDRAVANGTRLIDLAELTQQYKAKIIQLYYGRGGRIISRDNLEKFLSVWEVFSRDGQTRVVDAIVSQVSRGYGRNLIGDGYREWGGVGFAPVRVLLGNGVMDGFEDCWGPASGPGLEFKSLLGKVINNPSSFDDEFRNRFSVHQMDVVGGRLIGITPTNYIPSCRPI